jgi:hypothetical protein
MEDLDNSWILLNNEVGCRNNDDNSPETLGLKNMRGVFILVSLFSFRSVACLQTGYTYAQCRTKVEVRMEQYNQIYTHLSLFY